MIKTPKELETVVRISDNTVFVLSSYKANPLFLSFFHELSREKQKMNIEAVSAEELIKKQNEDNPVLTQDLQTVKIIKRIFADASNKSASDIHITLLNRAYTNIDLRVNGKINRYMQISYDDGVSVMRAVYQNISMSDTSYLENSYQAGQIHHFDNKELLPENVSSVRIQRGPVLNGQYMVLRILYKAKPDDAPHIQKIGRILLKNKIITEETLNTSLEMQQELRNKGRNIKLGDIMVSNNFINKIQLEEALSKQKGSLDLGLRLFQNYGYTWEQSMILAKAARQPQGLVIFSGPTGSGKSTALKVALEFQALMYPDKSIYTIEDPPEYPVAGAKQLPVLNANTENARDSKFAEGLRVAMRSDPDILMVGEIRDEATASVGLDAVITGHQMWTTIHASDVFSIFLRLLRFNLNKNDIYDEKLLNVLVGQRLLPKLCDCKIDYEAGLLDEDLDELLSSLSRVIKFKNPYGCEKCGYTGISGRVVVAEAVSITKDIMDEIKTGGVAYARRRFEESGFTIMKHAVKRLINGEIDPRDVISTVGNINPELLGEIIYGI